jgi:glycosyltransferase involved in cell wall biosynthesis
MIREIRTLSIIIPAYNEGPTIHFILDKLQQVALLNNIEKKIIIVNDCSKDSTEEAVKNYCKSSAKSGLI